MNYPQEDIKPYGEDGNKTEQVEQMFDNIAPAYDQLNHKLSLGIDRKWRQKAINCLRPYQPKRILDIATGTGDFAILACKELHPEQLTAIDISEGMMNIAREKVEKEGLSDVISFMREDCNALSFPDESFDAATLAFGARNFEDLDEAMHQIWRVLRDGGRLIVLELSTPEHFPMKQLYSAYSKFVIPFLGKRLSKDDCAYSYLPKTIKVCPQGRAMYGVLWGAGFDEITFKRLTFGTCTLYVAVK